MTNTTDNISTADTTQAIHVLFSNIWQDYIRLNPNVETIHNELKKIEPVLVNDHVAFRGLNRSGFDISKIAQPFLDLGYCEGEKYVFPEKKLDAIHLNPPEEGLPKVFISELKLEECSQDLQQMMTALLEQVTSEQLEASSFIYSGRPWNPVSYEVYQQLLRESEYAAWLYVFGFRANHFTVSINHLTKITSLEAMNKWLKAQGFHLNTAGGEIKGGPKDYLAQSSTLADKVSIEFVEGSHGIPSCFYEFAQRYPTENGKLFGGFVPASANKIFESTHVNKQS